MTTTYLHLNTVLGAGVLSRVLVVLVNELVQYGRTQHRLRVQEDRALRRDHHIYAHSLVGAHFSCFTCLGREHKASVAAKRKTHSDVYREASSLS